jgi:uncharacterized membrane protein YqhA
LIVKFVEFVAGMRFFVLIPVIGLAVAADILFIRGGIGLIYFLWKLILGIEGEDTQGGITVHLVVTVHFFLVGTVLFLTSLGLYELFIQSLPLPPWLKRII